MKEILKTIDRLQLLIEVKSKDLLIKKDEKIYINNAQYHLIQAKNELKQIKNG